MAVTMVTGGFVVSVYYVMCGQSVCVRVWSVFCGDRLSFCLVLYCVL